MATKNFLFSLALTSLVFTTACSSIQRRQNQEPIVYKPSPVEIKNNSNVTPSTVPVASGALQPVGVYFSAGAMRAYAHVGVLKALIQAQIPIVSVGGEEWGAVVAGLYSFSKSANDVEWQMMKLRKDQLPGSGILRRDIDVKENEALASYLRFVFADKNFDTAKTPFTCGTTDGSQALLLRGGRAWEQLMKCTILPPLYKPYENAGSTWYSGALNPGAWSEAMIHDGAKFIIYVDVVSEGQLLTKNHYVRQDQITALWTAVRGLSLAQHRLASMVLRVPLNSDLMDFDNRRELIKFGEKVGAGAIPDILKAIGQN